MNHLQESRAPVTWEDKRHHCECPPFLLPPALCTEHDVSSIPVLSTLISLQPIFPLYCSDVPTANNHLLPLCFYFASQKEANSSCFSKAVMIFTALLYTCWGMDLFLDCRWPELYIELPVMIHQSLPNYYILNLPHTFRVCSN